MNNVVSQKFRIISDHDLTAMLGNDGPTALRLLNLPGGEPTQPNFERALAIYGPPMTEREFQLWDRHMPNCYSYQDGEFVTYDYIQPPYEAALEILSAVELGIFTDVHIWTPVDDPDPIAVGVIETEDQDASYTLITQWGEAQLLTVEDLEQRYGTELDAELATAATREQARLEREAKLRAEWSSMSYAQRAKASGIRFTLAILLALIMGLVFAELTIISLYDLLHITPLWWVGITLLWTGGFAYLIHYQVVAPAIRRQQGKLGLS